MIQTCLSTSATQPSFLIFPRKQTNLHGLSRPAHLHPIRPMDTPLNIPPCGLDPYPCEMPATHTRMSQRVHWPNQLVSWIFSFPSADLDAWSGFHRLPRTASLGAGEYWVSPLTTAVKQFTPIITAGPLPTRREAMRSHTSNHLLLQTTNQRLILSSDGSFLWHYK